MPSAVKRVHYDELIFDVWENVYEPAEDTFLFAENLAVPNGAAVLDVGTGCGMLAILAAQKAESVVAIDINPSAVRCAKANSQNNGVRGKMAFLQADLFSIFQQKALFDVVTLNAPYLPAAESEVDSWMVRAWSGGANGRQVIDRFIAQVPFHLKPAGRVLLMQSTLANAEETLDNFEKLGFKAKIKASRALPFFETLTLIEAVAGV
jgi:release factor glutamine methyltransferase